MNYFKIFLTFGNIIYVTFSLNIRFYFLKDLHTEDISGFSMELYSSIYTQDRISLRLSLYSPREVSRDRLKTLAPILMRKWWSRHLEACRSSRWPRQCKRRLAAKGNYSFGRTIAIRRRAALRRARVDNKFKFRGARNLWFSAIKHRISLKDVTPVPPPNLAHPRECPGSLNPLRTKDYFGDRGRSRHVILLTLR